MARKQTLNKKLLAIGGGVVVVAALVLVGVYGKNIRTMTFLDGNAPTSRTKRCATQDEKQRAQTAYDTLYPRAGTLNALVRRAETELSRLHREIRRLMNERPVPQDRIDQLEDKAEEWEQYRDELIGELDGVWSALLRNNIILGLPLCSPSNTPTPEPPEPPGPPQPSGVEPSPYI